jgi:hypothetical protein
MSKQGTAAKRRHITLMMHLIFKIIRKLESEEAKV